MNSPLVPAQIPFDKGLLESQEPSKAPLGFLTECVNWIPEPTGGLRVRGSWSKGSTTGLPSPRRCKGIGMFQRLTDPTIVQTSSIWTSGDKSPGTQTPIVTWATPTQVGNTLVAFISAAATSAVTTSFTATGWTARNAVPATTSATVPVAGVYELVTTQSYAGDMTPFTANLGSTSYWTIFIVELAGVASGDVTAQANGSNTGAANSPYNQTVTTGATTQASELVLAFDSAYRTNTSTSLNAPFTLATTSTGFAAATATLSGIVGTNTSSAHSTLFTKTVRATGTQSITVAMTFTNTASDNNYQNVVVVTYKGWNSDPAPTDRGSRWLVANDDGATYDIWSVDRTMLSSDTWATTDTNLGDTTDGSPVAFTLGLGACWYTAASFGGLRRYEGTAAITVVGSPSAARCIAVNHTRLWAASGTRLSFSQIGDGSTWSGLGTGYFDVGRDDGEVIEDITPFLDGMVIGKRTSLHYLVGANTDEFELVQLNAGGAAPGRSVLSTPYGCIIAGREMVFSFDGSTVTPIGRGIEKSYGVADGEFVSLSYIDGSIYIAHGTSGTIFVYDLDAGVWRTEQIHDGGVESAAVLYNYGDTQLYGPVAGTNGSLLGFRSFPYPTRGKDFDPLTETFIAQTPDIPFGGARVPITPRQLWLQLRQRAGIAQTELIVTPYFDGVAGATCDIAPGTAGVRRFPVEGFGQSDGMASNTVGIRMTHTLSATEGATYDIEDAWVDYKPENARV